ncbi:hypothetical protein JZ751_007632 [Albula glossodonta]|uniref:AP180 N-terminal homology (ANTH) domain-containing protein n=1 Tax=Albula glossodonta TaxID=121402 RepID=A0A8T2MTX3_9TELE|nr:hypothetical protein JZ751_007632 [Albula glossodonta]
MPQCLSQSVWDWVQGDSSEPTVAPLCDRLSSISKAINSSETPGNLHDRYGQLLTVEVFDYLDAELKVAETVIRQLNTSIAISTTTSGQCRLAPLIQVIQDCSHLYHYTVKLLFKLHACELPHPPPSVLAYRQTLSKAIGTDSSTSSTGNVTRAEQSSPLSIQHAILKNFLNKARDMLYFKRLIQIPRLPDPVVVVEEEEPPDDDDPEPLIEVSEVTQPSLQVQPQLGLCCSGRRDIQIENMKREMELPEPSWRESKLRDPSPHNNPSLALIDPSPHTTPPLALRDPSLTQTPPLALRDPSPSPERPLPSHKPLPWP